MGYPNCTTYDEAMNYFWEKFDQSGWSIWHQNYNYNEDNKRTFMTSNAVGGFQQLSMKSSFVEKGLLHYFQNLSYCNCCSFVSQREAVELWVILKSLHTDGMRGNESDYRNLILFDKSRPCLGLVTSLPVHQADESFDCDLLCHGLEMHHTTEPGTHD